MTKEMIKKYPKEVIPYLENIIRNSLSILKNVNNSEIDQDDINECLNKGELPNYHIHFKEITSFENGKKMINYSLALISKESGSWYYSHIIQKK